MRAALLRVPLNELFGVICESANRVAEDRSVGYDLLVVVAGCASSSLMKSFELETYPVHCIQGLHSQCPTLLTDLNLCQVSIGDVIVEHACR